MKTQLVVGILGWALATSVAQQTNNAQSATALKEMPQFATIGKSSDQALGAIGIFSLGLLSKIETNTNANTVISDSLDLTSSAIVSRASAAPPKKPAVTFDHFAAEVYRAKGIQGLFDLKQPLEANKFKQRVLEPQRIDRVGRGASGLKLLSIGF